MRLQQSGPRRKGLKFFLAPCLGDRLNRGDPQSGYYFYPKKAFEFFLRICYNNSTACGVSA